MDLISPDPQPTTHLIQAVCNVPSQSTVSLYCPSSSVQPPISTGNQIINSTNNGQIVAAQSVFPPNFQGTLEMIFTPPNGAQPGAYNITIKQYTLDGAALKHLGSYTFDINL